MKKTILFTMLMSVGGAMANSVEFEEPFRLEAGGEIICAESPGYACPTVFDLDADGKEDLIVGQFNGGKMMFYKNIGIPGKLKFAKGTWLMNGKKPASVPGVW